MLEWEQRIGLCRLLLTEMIDLSRPNDDDLGRHLEMLDEYLSSVEFRVKDRSMKENETICMLGDVIMECSQVYSEICSMAEKEFERMQAKKRRRMTMDEVKEEFSRAYADAIKEGDGIFLSTNVNDWIRDNGIEIEKRKRKAVSKEGKSDGTKKRRKSGKED